MGFRSIAGFFNHAAKPLASNAVTLGVVYGGLGATRFIPGGGMTVVGGITAATYVNRLHNLHRNGGYPDDGQPHTFQVNPQRNDVNPYFRNNPQYEATRQRNIEEYNRQQDQRSGRGGPPQGYGQQGQGGGQRSSYDPHMNNPHEGAINAFLHVPAGQLTKKDLDILEDAGKWAEKHHLGPEGCDRTTRGLAVMADILKKDPRGDELNLSKDEKDFIKKFGGDLAKEHARAPLSPPFASGGQTNDVTKGMSALDRIGHTSLDRLTSQDMAVIHRASALDGYGKDDTAKGFAVVGRIMREYSSRSIEPDEQAFLSEIGHSMGSSSGNRAAPERRPNNVMPATGNAYTDGGSRAGQGVSAAGSQANYYAGLGMMTAIAGKNLNDLSPAEKKAVAIAGRAAMEKNPNSGDDPAVAGQALIKDIVTKAETKPSELSQADSSIITQIGQSMMTPSAPAPRGMQP